MKIRLQRPFDRRVSWLGVGACLALVSAGAAQEPARATEATEAAASRIVYQQPDLTAAEQQFGSLVRVPLDFGAPTVTVAGGVRSWMPAPRTVFVLAPAAALAPTAVLVLAPTRIAHSLSSQPTLYWYVSGPSGAPVRLSVQGIGDTRPILDVELGQAPIAGVYATALADYDLHLESNRLYRWSVAIELEPGSSLDKPQSETIVAIADGRFQLRAKLSGEAPLAQIQTLARSGYWYDALDLLTRRIAAGDASQPWRELHAALLDQVGLQPVAAFERGDRGVPYEPATGSNRMP